MRVLLRNVQTGQFYVGPEQWSETDAEAMDFGDTELALDCVWENHLTGMEVVMRFDEPFFEIPLRVVASGR